MHPSVHCGICVRLEAMAVGALVVRQFVEVMLEELVYPGLIDGRVNGG